MNKYNIESIIMDDYLIIDRSKQKVNAINIATVVKMLPVILEEELKTYSDKEFEINIKLCE